MITALPEPLVRHAPTTRREIAEAIEATHEVGVAYWSAYTTPEFFAPLGGHWSASEHVRHLTRSMRPIVTALGVPRVVLRVAFGAAARESRTLSELQAAYHAALDAGGTAGRYAPPPDRATPDMARRDEIMDTHSETLRSLTRAMKRWSEAQLDASLLPHPLLGRVTMREMMLFAVIHNQHHVDVAERRRLETRDSSTSRRLTF